MIDDCSHLGYFTARSFAYLFPLLRSGGLYAIEDICASFLPSFPDADRYSPPTLGEPGQSKYFACHQNGMIGVVKQIFDHVMAPIADRHSTPKFPIERMTVLPNIALIYKA